LIIDGRDDRESRDAALEEREMLPRSTFGLLTGKAICLLAATLMLSATTAQAAAIWGSSGEDELVGSRDTSATGGATGTKDWADGGFNIAWDISFDEDTELWTYIYHVTANRKEVSHLLLEVTEGDGGVLIDEGSSNVVAPTTYTATSNGNSNPLMPNPLYGVKFDYGDLDEVYTIVTDRAPVYGVFYAKDGKSGGIDVVAYANALKESDYKTDEALTINDFIVRPNGKHGPDPDPGGDPDPPTNAVPEPMTASLAAVAAASLLLATRRRR
jgi:hypothetical protein